MEGWEEELVGRGFIVCFFSLFLVSELIVVVDR